MLSPAILDLAGFKARTIMQPADVDRLETGGARPNFVTSRIALRQAFIEARLRKRYTIPLPDDSEAVRGWLVALVTFDCYGARGFNPSSEQDRDVIVEEKNAALADIKEAADSETGLFDLPLRADTVGVDGTAIDKGGPFFYAESDAYEWTDVQAEQRRYRR